MSTVKTQANDWVHAVRLLLTYRTPSGCIVLPRDEEGELLHLLTGVPVSDDAKVAGITRAVAVAFWRALDGLDADVVEPDVASPATDPPRVPWNDTCWLPPASPASWQKMKRVIQGFLMMHGLERGIRSLPDDGTRMLMDVIALLSSGCGDGDEQPIALALAEMFKRFVRRLDLVPDATKTPIIGANEALVPGESSEWMTESRRIRMVGIRSLMRGNHEADVAFARFEGNKNTLLEKEEPGKMAFARDPLRTLQRALAQPDSNLEFFYRLNFSQQQDLIMRAVDSNDTSEVAELCRRTLERAPYCLLAHITASAWTMPAAHLYSSLQYALGLLPPCEADGDRSGCSLRARAIGNAQTSLRRDHCYDAAVVLLLAHYAPTQVVIRSLQSLTSDAIQNIRASLPAAQMYRDLAPSMFDQMAQLQPTA